MGYSGRYHAASLAAVFVALAIGILIGIGLADDVVSSASQEVEDTLRADLDDAEVRIDELETDLDRSEQFDEQAGPALVANRLNRQRVALIALGDLPDEETALDAQRAIESAGGELSAIAILEMPPDLEAIRDGSAAAFGRAAGRAPSDELGAAIGRQLVGGGPLVDRLKDELFSRFTGELEGVTRVVFVSGPAEDLQADLSGEARRYEAGLIDAVDEAAAGVVGTERSDTDPTTISQFSAAGISTVDNVDQVPGQVSLVFALLGAQGDFGVKEEATSLLPDLLPGQAQPAGP